MAADGSAAPQLSDAAISIEIGKRGWKIGDAIYSIRNPLFTCLQGRQPIPELNPVYFFDLFFHKQPFLAMVKHTNATISDDSLKVDEEDMRSFVGIMFAMTE
jgi:hypothetical protein